MRSLALRDNCLLFFCFHPMIFTCQPPSQTDYSPRYPVPPCSFPPPPRARRGHKSLWRPTCSTFLPSPRDEWSRESADLRFWSCVDSSVTSNFFPRLPFFFHEPKPRRYLGTKVLLPGFVGLRLPFLAFSPSSELSILFIISVCFERCYRTLEPSTQSRDSKSLPDSHVLFTI